MKITPLEIRQKTFENKFRGYEKEEVDAFLQALSFEWEHLNNDLRETKSKLDSAEKDVAKLREVESSLYKALKTAEDTGNNMLNQASKAAKLQLKEAQMDAEMLLSEAKRQARYLIEEAEEAAKGAIEQAKFEVKKLESDYNVIANHRENLLHELKSIASDVLERSNRYLEKPGNITFETPELSEEVNEELLDFSLTEKANTTNAGNLEGMEEDELPAVEMIEEEKPEQIEFEVNTSFSEPTEEKEDQETKEENSKTNNSDDEEEQSSFFDKI